MEMVNGVSVDVASPVFGATFGSGGVPDVCATDGLARFIEMTSDVFKQLIMYWPELQLLWAPVSLPALVLAALVLGTAAVLRLLLGRTKPPAVYILDFAVHKPDPSWRFPRAEIRTLCEKRGLFSDEDVAFQEKIAYRTGLGDDTAVCPAIQSGDASQLGIEAARFEFGATCFPTISALLEKAGVSPRQVDYVITNSSLFNPTPSLSASIINHFKMGQNTIGYSLGGMGCSAGVIALDLARELLTLHPGRLALVVSHENITNNYYTGRDRSMLIPNCLFRSNGSAVLLSTARRVGAARAKYTLPLIVRTHLAADETAYACVYQTEDADGNLGVRLNKDLMTVGADALRANLARLGPAVLPWSELARYAAVTAARRAVKQGGPLGRTLKAALPARALEPYVPDFGRAFSGFCIHTGGRGIIDGLERQMRLSREEVEPSRASLFRFGNTSSTSIWYELAYMESKRGLRAGQRVWQLAFGSGFKFNSAVLVADRDVREAHAAWDGFDSEAMWRELDALEKAVAAGRAGRASSGGAKRQQRAV